ncbi:ROK family protein, partial [Streptomyces scopuliridis]|uniref:ROK family protein n=1 Tax=Streptomyces scopuliridis TaxID=452529 RepID=UPI0035E29E28
MPEAPQDDGPARSLPPEHRAVLHRWAEEGGPLATRARVVLLAADGLRDAEISRRLGVSRQTAGTWRRRWRSAGIDGLGHRPRTGRPATVDEAEVVTRTLLAPGGSGASRAVARELGLSHATVAGIRRRWRLSPGEAPVPSVPTRPPLPGAEVWVMGLYVDPRRAVLLAGTRQGAPRQPAAGTVPGTDVLAGLTAAVEAALTAAMARGADGDTSPAHGGLAEYLAEAARGHPDLGLHAITLWETSDGPESRQQIVREGMVTQHQIPARSTWRTFLRAMIALDSTAHPESSRRVYLDLAAELERYAAARPGTPCAAVRWLRENVAGHPGAGHHADSPAGRRPWSGVAQIDLGSFNECVVIETVRLSGTITRAEIAHRTGLTQQSVSRIARSLLNRGILIEDAQRRAAPGRPRTPVRLCGTAAHALGIHIDPEVLTAVVIDLDGAIVRTRTRPVTADIDPAEFVRRVAALGRETLAEARGSVREDGFLGIGVAVPGPVDIASGTVLGPPLMSAWGDLPLLYLLQDHFPCPVLMEKDSTAAAAGERWIGRECRARDFAYLYLGTGVGTGLYLNGDLYRGISANAGEFGQLCAIALGRMAKDGRPEILPECNPPVSVPELALRGGMRPVRVAPGDASGSRAPCSP